MYLNIQRTISPLLVIKISRTTSLQRWKFSFALKRNETKQYVQVNRSFTKTTTQHASNIRRKKWVQCLKMTQEGLPQLGPIWGIHSLTLVISCAFLIMCEFKATRDEFPSEHVIVSLTKAMV